MKHRFLLGKIGLSGFAPIKYEVHFGGERFACGTGVNIPPEIWDQKNMLPVREKSIIKEYKGQIKDLPYIIAHVDKRIQDIKNEVNSYLTNCKITSAKPDKEVLRAMIKGNLISKDKVSPKGKKVKDIENAGTGNITDYLEGFIRSAERGNRTISFGKSKGKKFTEGTIKNYKGLLNVLRDFQKYLGFDLTWEGVSMQTYKDFINFCHGKNFSTNYSGRHIKQLKSIGREAKDEGIHTNDIFNDRRFSTLTAPSDSIYLTSSELNELSKLDLSGKKIYGLVRDMFLAGCWTAQRWSDYSRFHAGMIQGNNLTLIQKKSNLKVVIPVKPELREILTKYPSGFPRMAEQTFNEKLKIIGKLAGIDTPVEKREFKAGVDHIKRYCKYELMSSHTARRTGATLMALNKIPTSSIMKITGHKTESSFWKYIKSSGEENANLLQEFDFFK